MHDREKVISTFEKIISVCKEDGCDFVDLSFEDAEQIFALLEEQEAVVRCADCRHADISPSGLIKCRGIFRSKDWFCADGVKKT